MMITTFTRMKLEKSTLSTSCVKIFLKSLALSKVLQIRQIGMENPNQFKLEALSTPRSIRLVVLHRSAKNNSVQEPLSCRLVEANVDCPPSYVALSYTWGGEESCEPLTIQSSGSARKQLLITPNCAAALRLLRRSLRRKTKNRRSLSVWIDAICIDQASDDERNAQVAMMAEIYQRANTVVVWLGEDHAPASWGSLACSKPLALFPRLGYDRGRNEGVKSLAARIALKGTMSCMSSSSDLFFQPLTK